MAAYKKMYLKLLGAVSDAIELLQKSSLEAEEMYISSDSSSAPKTKPTLITQRGFHLVQILLL